MPPKAAEKDKDTTQFQLLYAMILQTGSPTGKEMWEQVAARLPEHPKAETVRKRWERLQKRWDEEKIFGDKHERIVAEALDALGKGVKKDGSDKKKGDTEEKAKAKGTVKGKKKVVITEDEVESGEEGDGPEETLDTSPAKKRKVTKAKKQLKKVVTAKQDERDDMEDSETEV